MEIVCGLSSAGVPVATIGPAAPPAEIRFVCEDSRARVLFVAPELEEAARAAAPASVERFIVLGPEYEALLASAGTSRCPVAVSETDVFSVPYTSGATGRAKGRDADASRPDPLVLRDGRRSTAATARTIAPSPPPRCSTARAF